MKKKKPDQEKRVAFFRFAITPQQKARIITIAKEEGKSYSQFIRDAIDEKIRRIKQPELFETSNLHANPKLLEQLTKDTKTILALQEKQAKDKAMANGIDEAIKAIRKEYERLRKRGLIADYSKETETIANLLKTHNSLTPEQIHSKTGIDVEKSILILQLNDVFKLNITTGRYELR